MTTLKKTFKWNFSNASVQRSPPSTLGWGLNVNDITKKKPEYCKCKSEFVEEMQFHNFGHTEDKNKFYRRAIVNIRLIQLYVLKSLEKNMWALNVARFKIAKATEN